MPLLSTIHCTNLNFIIIHLALALCFSSFAFALLVPRRDFSTGFVTDLLYFIFLTVNYIQILRLSPAMNAGDWTRWLLEVPSRSMSLWFLMFCFIYFKYFKDHLLLKWGRGLYFLVISVLFIFHTLSTHKETSKGKLGRDFALHIIILQVLNSIHNLLLAHIKVSKYWFVMWNRFCPLSHFWLTPVK